MDIRKIKTFQQIEEFIEVYYKLLPSLQKKLRKNFAVYFGPLVVLAGIYHLVIALLPEPYSIIHTDNLLKVNILMIKGVFIILGIALITSYSHLRKHQLKGWYNVFYITFFHFFLSLVIFNLPYFIAQLLVWYLLFQIKEFYAEKKSA